MDASSGPSEWWYASSGERRGPVSDQELQRLLASGQLGANSLVWKHGMKGWQQAGHVQALASFLAKVPPELPGDPTDSNEAYSPRGSSHSSETGWRSLFFSFQGRISRKPFWIGALLLFVTSWVGHFFAGVAGGLLGRGVITLLLLLAVTLLVAFGWLSIMIKRLHDLDWSGWWALLAYSPVAVIAGSAAFKEEALAPAISLAYVASLLFIIMVGSLKGTTGPNRYGSNPLATGDELGTHQGPGKVAEVNSMKTDLRSWFSSVVEMAGGSAFFGLYIFGFAGWAYWMWLAIKFGSFLMFFLGLLGPLAFVAALLGMWSLVFGVPVWLVSLVS